MITDNEAKRLVFEMFEAGQLDPYPTSDAAPEYRLREWCGFKTNEDEGDDE